MMQIEFKIANDSVLLTPERDSGNEKYYRLIDTFGRCLMEIEMDNREFKIIRKDATILNTQEELNAKLDRLILDIIESEQSGTENTEDNNDAETNPYNPDDIKVSSNQFSIKLIKEMIDSGDLILNPAFQRHLVWDNLRRSRLIESVLLRIPLPMFYFSEDKEGKLTVIDGLQRLTTINDFMNNKFALKNLEYLRDSCESKFYNTLEPKYTRWFNLTQISGNVIDPSSPYKVKYDIFRRINTGGKPLNNQEIRNCLAGKALRETLQEMVSSEAFKTATDYSIKPARMDDEEVALRFILFRDLLTEDKKIENYSGYIETSLDELTEKSHKSTKDNLMHYVTEFSTAMKNAGYLFGNRHAFRKIQLKDIQPDAPKQLINKALFVSWSVLLADYKTEKVIELNKEKTLLEPLAKAIQNDMRLLRYLSYGTNGKANMQYTFFCANKIIREYLNY